MDPNQPEMPPQNPFASPAGIPSQGMPHSSSNEAAATVVPYRNVSALIAYYCAVFSLIPCLGLILGPVAFVLGIIGFMAVRKNPQLHGTVHAWIGIILGGLTFAGNAVLILIPVLAGILGR